MTGSHDATATVWDYETLMPIKSHFNADWAVNAAGFSHDSQYLATGGEENEINISDTYTGAAPGCTQTERNSEQPQLCAVVFAAVQ